MVTSLLAIIILVIVVIVLIVWAGYWLSVIKAEENESRIPGPDEVVIVQDDEYHTPEKGDFYIRDTRDDMNPFEAFNIYRIDDVRKNIYGDLWVKYTAPGFGRNYEPKWKELECPLHSFVKGKVRVERVKKERKNKKIAL